VSRTIPRALVLLALLGSGWCLQADAQGLFSLGIGAEYGSGRYGGSERLTDRRLSFTGVYETRRFAYRLTVPYVEVEFPALVTGGANEAANAPSTVTESGLGDLIAAVTMYDVYRSPSGEFALDVTGKVKLATADETRGLGTGEHDFSLEAGLYRFFDRWIAVAGAGYTVRGEPAGFRLDNTWSVSAGTVISPSPRLRTGAFLDYRQASLRESAPVREATAFLSLRMRELWWGQVYALRGLSDSSPDWAIGFSARRDF
jgi:hypothetical protein